jgi:tetratricopeptide (TPR) repeat protein
MTSSRRDTALLLTYISFGLFLAGRLLGIGPFSSVWSLSHWSVMSLLDIGVWAVVIALLTFIFLRLSDSVMNPPAWAHWIIVPVLVLLFVLFRFDSFVYGGGNLRVADIGQVPLIIYRWFEIGTVGIVGALFEWLRSMEIPVREASVNAWVIQSLIAGGAAIIGATLLATRLAKSLIKRILLICIMLFGGHALVWFGYVGVEAIIPTLTIWFGVTIGFYCSQRTILHLLYVWLIAALALLFHISMIILLPACVYLTLQHFSGKKKSAAPLIASLLALLVIILALYSKAGQSLELRSVILFFEGKRPFTDYRLFSARHLLDFVQLLFLGAPTLIVTGFLLWRKKRSTELSPMIGALSIVALGGLIAMFLLDPIHSIVLDTPRLMAYLSPLALLLAILVADSESSGTISPQILPYLAVVAIAVTFATLPVYRTIALTDRYALPYLNEFNAYHPVATMAFRDAHFHRKEIDIAREWENDLAARSADYLLLRGTEILRQNGNVAAAVEEQRRIIIKLPFWTQPRAMLASNLMSLGQHALAKPHIDTCLMLEPYGKTHWVNLYGYYRSIQDWPNAVKSVAEAEEIFPGDVEIRTDRMLIFYRANDIVAATIMADELLAADTLLPFPYLVKGLIEDRNSNLPKALLYYERFLTLAPTEPEAARIQQRVDSLKSVLPN